MLTGTFSAVQGTLWGTMYAWSAHTRTTFSHQWSLWWLGCQAASWSYVLCCIYCILTKWWWTQVITVMVTLMLVIMVKVILMVTNKPVLDHSNRDRFKVFEFFWTLRCFWVLELVFVSVILLLPLWYLNVLAVGLLFVALSNLVTSPTGYTRTLVFFLQMRDVLNTLEIPPVLQGNDHLNQGYPFVAESMMQKMMKDDCWRSKDIRDHSWTGWNFMHNRGVTWPISTLQVHHFISLLFWVMMTSSRMTGLECEPLGFGFSESFIFVVTLPVLLLVGHILGALCYRTIRTKQRQIQDNHGSMAVTFRTVMYILYPFQFSGRTGSPRKILDDVKDTNVTFRWQWRFSEHWIVEVTVILWHSLSWNATSQMQDITGCLLPLWSPLSCILYITTCSLFHHEFSITESRYVVGIPLTIIFVLYKNSSKIRSLYHTEMSNSSPPSVFGFLVLCYKRQWYPHLFHARHLPNMILNIRKLLVRTRYTVCQGDHCSCGDILHFLERTCTDNHHWSSSCLFDICIHLRCPDRQYVMVPFMNCRYCGCSHSRHKWRTRWNCWHCWWSQLRSASSKTWVVSVIITYNKIIRWQKVAGGNSSASVQYMSVFLFFVGSLLAVVFTGLIIAPYVRTGMQYIKGYLPQSFTECFRQKNSDDVVPLLVEYDQVCSLTGVIHGFSHLSQGNSDCW